MNRTTQPDIEVADYQRVAAAIEHLSLMASEQPTLEELASAVNLSPGHMQRTFQRWAGISPKRFLQHLTVEYAKRILRNSESILDAAIESGLSGPSRLHDHFVNLEAVTPGEYKNGGGGMDIRWDVHPSPFGRMFLAVTGRGICALHFLDEESPHDSISRVSGEWPGAILTRDHHVTAAYAGQVFKTFTGERPLNVLVRGTNFQIQVWRALLEIPAGMLTTYSSIAGHIGKPGASRAVGSAIGANRVSWLIPCHRVIRTNGVSGAYRWGPARKQLMNGWEAAKQGVDVL